MSAHQPKQSNDSGELPFAPTLRKTIVILLIGFATPVIALLLIVHFISSETTPPAGSRVLSASEAAQRIAPVGRVAVASSASAASAANAAATSSAAAPATAAASGAAGATVADAGKKLYASSCVACHGAGIAGAPKVGDKAAWAPRIAKGEATLVDHAIHGYAGKSGAMPPRGGSNASDDDVKAAVAYMVAKSS